MSVGLWHNAEMSHLLRPKGLRWAVLTAALVLLPLLVLHTDWVQGHVLRFALQRLSPDGSITARRLDYNILNLRLRIEGLELRSPGDPRPYFTADEVHLDAPWSAIWEPTLEHLILVQPRFHVVTDADGTSNFTGGGSRVEVALPIDRLELQGLSVQWEDERYDVSFRAERLDVRIAETQGESWLRQPQAAEIRRGEATEELRLTDGTIGWDGLAGLLRALRLESAPLTLRADGRIDELLADRALALEAGVSVELEALESLLPEIAPIEGSVNIDATIGGTAAAPEIEVNLAAPRLYRGQLGLDDVEARLRWSGSLQIDRFRGRLAGGELTAEGRLGLGVATSELRAQWRAVELAPLVDALTEDGAPWPTATTMDGELTMAWPTFAPEAGTTTVSLDVELQRTGADGLAGAVRARLNDGELNATIDVGVPDRRTSMQADMTGTVIDQAPWLVAIEGALDARADLSRFADVIAASRISAGTVQFRGHLTGDLDAPRLTAEIEVEQMQFDDIAALEPVDMRAEFTADATTWSLTALQATAGNITVAGNLGGTVEPPTFSGTLDATVEEAGAHFNVQIAGSADLRTLEGRAQVQFTDLARFARSAQELTGSQIPTVTGRAAADVEFAGGISALTLTGSISADELTVATSSPFTLRSHFETAPAGTRITELTLRGPGAELALSGSIGPGGRNVDLVAELLVNDPAQASGQAWLASVRQIHASAALRHDRDAGTLLIDLQQLRVELPQRTLRTTRPARVVWNADGLAVEGLHLAAGKTTLEVEGSLPAGPGRGAIVTRVTGNLGDLDNLVNLAWRRATGSEQPAPNVTGEFDVQLTIDGNLDSFAASGSAELRSARITSSEFGSVENIDVTMRVTASELRVESLSATWRGAAIRGSGTVPLAYLPGISAYVRPAADAAAIAKLELRSLSTTMLADFLPESMATDIGGEADVTIELEAARPELAALAGEIRLDTLRFWRGDLEVSQRRPTRLELHGTRLTFADLEWASSSDGGPSVRVSGSIDISPTRPYESVLDLHAAATADLSWFNGFVTAAALGGHVHLDVDVGGSPAAPKMSGQVNLENVSMAVREPRLRVSGLTGTLRLDGTRVDTEGIAGLANGGDVMLFVNLDMATPLSPTGTVGISGRGVALQAAEVRADTDVSLTLSTRGEEGATLFGAITVLAGGYRSNQSLSAAMLGGTGAVRPDESERETSTFLERLSYDIRIESVEDLVVDTRDADLSLALDLQIVGAGTRPGVLGQVRLNEGGEVRLGGNTLIIDRGSVDFANANRIAPTLDITATSRVRQYDVSVRLSGDAFSPTLEARASDGLSQADALSLLAVGRTLEETGGAGAEILAEQAFNMVAGRMGGLGIASSVRFEQAQSADNSRSLAEPDLFPQTTDLAARLSFKRSFGESFDLIYSQGLTNTTDQSWIGVWRLPWSLQLQGGTFDDDARSVELLHSIKFGRAPNDRHARGRGVDTRVDEIRIGGNPDRPESELLGVLALSAGDRFDFIKWRRDVERLERLYLEDGYYEIKVRGRRSPIGQLNPDSGVASRVALVYEIIPGPRTVLTVEGYSFKNKEVAQSMQRLWQHAVADDFLLQDLAREARRAMVEQGHVTATANAAFYLDTELERRIRVDVRPGPRFGKVEIEIEGADTLGADSVRQHLASAGLERGTWWDPDATLRAVRALHRQAGFPETDVEIAEARFEAGRATARIIVREGTARLLRNMTFTGNAAISDKELRSAVAVNDGDRLTPAAIDEAATAVESSYLQRGYNNVAVTMRREPSDGGMVLALQIQEGPRRILREIEIVGRHRTRLSVLERAIKLRPGDAAVLSELQSIRRRLMDTGALRSASLQVVNLGGEGESEAPAKLIVTVVEKAMFDVSYGVQVLSDTLNDRRRTRPGVSAIVAHDNFLGVGARVSVLGRYRKDEPFGRAALGFPSLLGLPIETTFVAQKAREEIGAEGAFTIRREETRFLGEQRVTFGHLTVGYSYSWERNLNQILELPPDSPFQLPAVTVARLIPTLIWDGRDDAFSPRRGIFHSSTVEIAPEALGSELEFWKYSGQQFFFVPIGPVVLATAVRFGTGSSNDPNSDILPRGELFTVGGGTTVRGYPDDSLGRTEFFGSFFAGGNAMLILNQEARFPIWRWFEGVAFIDAGNAFAEASEIHFASLAYSAGAGLRLVTPVLSLRLDYGFRLTTIDYLEPATGRLHFGIGHIF